MAATVLQGQLSPFDGGAYVFYTRQNGGKRYEFTIEFSRHDARQCGFSTAGRTPEDHRMRFAGFERQPQRFACTEQMLLTYDIRQLLRA